MAIVKDDEFVVARGDGARRVGRAGTEYIDAKGGLWYCAVGHGRAEIADAAREQMRDAGRLRHLRRHRQPAGARAGRARIGDRPDARTARCSSAAAGRTRSTPPASWRAATGTRSAGPARRIIVHRDRRYHGMNAYGTQPGRDPGEPRASAPWSADIAGVPTDDTEALAELFERDGDRIAAFIGEPVIGAGGVFHPRRRLLAARARAVQQARRAADRRRGDLRDSAGSASGSAASASASSPTWSPAPRASRPATSRSAP